MIVRIYLNGQLRHTTTVATLNQAHHIAQRVAYDAGAHYGIKSIAYGFDVPVACDHPSIDGADWYSIFVVPVKTDPYSGSIGSN